MRSVATEGSRAGRRAGRMAGSAEVEIPALSDLSARAASGDPPRTALVSAGLLGGPAAAAVKKDKENACNQRHDMPGWGFTSLTSGMSATVRTVREGVWPASGSSQSLDEASDSPSPRVNHERHGAICHVTPQNRPVDRL